MSEATDVLFNPDELATWGQAEHIAKEINRNPIFIAANIFVATQTDDPATAGIYVPAWGGGFQEPSGAKTFWLHFRFTNGFSGMNVGLVRTQFAKYPSAPLYVMGWLLQQVQQGF